MPKLQKAKLRIRGENCLPNISWFSQSSLKTMTKYHPWWAMPQHACILTNSHNHPYNTRLPLFFPMTKAQIGRWHHGPRVAHWLWLMQDLTPVSGSTVSTLLTTVHNARTKWELMTTASLQSERPEDTWCFLPLNFISYHPPAWGTPMSSYLFCLLPILQDLLLIKVSQTWLPLYGLKIMGGISHYTLFPEL